MTEAMPNRPELPVERSGLQGTGHLDELDDETCWKLLGAEGVGRIAWGGPGGPTVIPVNYRVTDREIQVRTAAYSAMAREARDEAVAFEADAIDDHTRTGWSVLVQGRLRLDDQATALDGPRTWAPGSRSLHLVIEPHQVSGRRLRRAG